MKYCEICGQPSGIYEVCQNCQKKVNEGKIRKCLMCNGFFVAGTNCPCTQKKTAQTPYKNAPAQQPTQKSVQTPAQKIEYNVYEKKSHPFSDGFKGALGCGCGFFAFIIILIFIIAFFAFK